MKDSDLKVIEFQLGRKAENFARVIKYCPFSKPAVLLTYPYSKKNGVFPTSYWLSCPFLNKEVAKLEDAGLVKELSDKLKVDDSLRRQLMESHNRYARERYSLLEKEDIKELEKMSPGIKKVLKNSGVGGIMDMEGIKCLHTHLADYLVSKENAIGKLVWDILDWPDNCDICMKDDINER